MVLLNEGRILFYFFLILFQINIITTNARFLLDIFLSHCFKMYSASTGNVNPQIHSRLKSEFGVIPTQNITGYI